MQDKICSRCSIEYTHYGQRSSFCKECRKSYDREHYLNKSPESKQKKYNNQLKRTKEITNFINLIKSKKGCTDCGIQNPIVLDFDHLNTYTKSFNIGDARKNGYGKIRILEEIEKCEVVCSNCHRIRTHNRRNDQ